MRDVRAYDRGQLLSLYAATQPAAAVAECIRSAGLWTSCRLHYTRRSAVRSNDPLVVCLKRYRGCRAGRSKRLSPSLRSVGNGASIVVGNRRLLCCEPSRLDPSLLQVHINRHPAPPCTELVFGSLNICAIANKIDDLLEVRRCQKIDVLFLVETWHDSDSVSLRRLRADGFQIVDRPRPRTRANTLDTNHGGIAAVAVPGVRLVMMDIGVKPTTFEFLCVRVATGTSSCIAAVVYRPGSAAVSSTFFVEFSDVVDRLALLTEPVYIVGDINIRLERQADTATRQLTDVLCAHSLVNCVTTATHDRGGILDIVAARDDLRLPSVDVIDVGLSDHRLLRWPAPLPRPCPVYTPITCRPWKRLESAAFRAALLSSPLCHPDSWTELGLDDLALLYDSVVTGILDRMIPIRTAMCRRRATDPWFDDDCRNAKRCVRQLEREARRADSSKRAAATAAWRTRRREYCVLRQQKCDAFWKAKVAAEGSNPRQLWQSIDTLLGRGRPPPCSAVDAEEMHRFFDEKVAGVRAATDNAPPPTFSAAPPNCEFRDYRRLTSDDVTAAVRLLPDKQCASDPLPTRLLKDNVDLLAPFLVELFNRSLTLGIFPAGFKAAYVTPLLKKPDLDPADAKSYRPISNLAVLSKLLERLVARQLIDYLTASRLLPDLQSAYRAHHSTETAVLKVLSDILLAVDSGDLAMLSLLDLSAAFDTVDHATIIRRLGISYGLGGTTLSWFTSYLGGRTQSVRCRGCKSTPRPVLCGVPQGSVLGPILFLLYTADLLRLVQSHGLHPHLYADDTQIYGFCPPAETAQLQGRVSACIADVAQWMRSNRLQLNTSKTEILWCSSARRQHQIPAVPVMVGPDAVMPSHSVRDLGIYLDSDVSMRTHVAKTVSSCFAVLRQIRSICRSLTRPVLVSLVVTLVLTRLDYGCATLAGLPDILLNRLQSVLNAAARLINSVRKFDHVTSLLQDLHWLRVPERIKFRLAVLVYRCLHDLAPPYLATDLHRLADIDSRRRLRSGSTAELDVPLTNCSTIGDRAFPVAAARIWNDLPSTVTSSPSLAVFRQRLKTELFTKSYGVPRS